MEEHGNNVSGTVSTELTALRYNADKTVVQSVLITYTEPRLASPQSLLLDLQCGHEKAPPNGPGVTGLLLRAQAALGCEEGPELHTASPRKGVPAGDNAGTRPLWLLINGEGTAHTEGTFDSGGQALHPLLQQPCFTVFILEWSFSHAHPQGTHRKCCKVLPPGHHCGEFFYIRDTICLFPCLSRQKMPHFKQYVQRSGCRAPSCTASSGSWTGKGFCLQQPTPTDSKHQETCTHDRELDRELEGSHCEP